MDWTPVRKREARRLLAWALLVLLPMSVSSCDGQLNVTYGYVYLQWIFLGTSLSGVVLGGLGVLGLGFVSLGLFSIWSQSGYTRWVCREHRPLAFDHWGPWSLSLLATGSTG